MKLFIITQVIDKNDEVLGFFHGWVDAFAKECERVTVIALRVGEYEFPPNVHVYSLGKEQGVSRLKYIMRFFHAIVSERKNYDAVFVHMNQVYVLLGGFLWKIMGKKIGLWYAHGHVPFSLRAATVLADKVFTSTASGFRIPSTKVSIIGQGIDIERFECIPHERVKGEPFRVIVVGRISPVKDYETTMRAIAELAKNNRNVVLDVIGSAGLPEQEEYLLSLKRLAKELDCEERIIFHGGVPNAEIAELLEYAHCFASSSHTGSFDKAVGEAMASGLPILTSNVAFKEVLGALAPQLMFPVGDYRALAQEIARLEGLSNEERNQIGKTLSECIGSNHSLVGFVKKLLLRY